ncbi:hypothetical protein ACJJTC_006885 [Scirpophaga incertulas]
MDLVISVNNQTNGRDKIARLFQYTSRLIWYQLEVKNANKYSIDRIKHLELALGSFRKILRLGRCVDFWHLSLNCSNIDDPILRFTITASKLAHSLFLYSDHIVWLTKSGFLNTDYDKWNQRANKFWLLSIVANLARDLYEIIHLLEINKSIWLKPSNLVDGSVRNMDLSYGMRYICSLVDCHKDIFIDTLKNSCDLFIPLTALGFTKLTPSTVGILGMISSLAALVTIVKPITKLVPA